LTDILKTPRIKLSLPQGFTIMNRLDRIQRISGLLRYTLLLLAAGLCGAIAVSALVPGQSWVTLGDGQLTALHGTGMIGTGLAIALAAPIGLLLALGIYWLQRLFAEYQQGNFFTDGNMRCYLWLVWLKAGGFVYSILWPLLLSGLLPADATIDVGITIEAGTLVELSVLLLIVYLLREAQQIHDENQAFV
jgi:hypothetical protein